MAYANVLRSTYANTKPGLSDTVYFALQSDISTWGAPTGTPTNPGDTVLISTAHTFASGKHAYSVDCKLRSPQHTAASEGDVGETIDKHTLVFDISGQGPELLEMLRAWQNDNLVFWAKDPNCTSGTPTYYQFGDNCIPVQVTFVYDSRKSSDNGKPFYTVTVKSEYALYFYEAAIALS